MQDILSRIGTLRRPPLLIRAARFGVENYRRDLHLKRYAFSGQLPRPGRALVWLLEEEDRLNGLRLLHDASYSAARHVHVMISILGEARALRSARATQGAAQGAEVTALT